MHFEGRCVIISVFLYGERLILPIHLRIFSISNCSFLAYLFPYISPLVILGGDVNFFFEPELSPLKSTCSSKMAMTPRELCIDLNLFDTWRILNPKVEDFYRPHNSRFHRFPFKASFRHGLSIVV